MRFLIGILLFCVQIQLITTQLTFVKLKKARLTNSKLASAIRKLVTSSLIKCTAICDQTEACAAVSFSTRGICELSKYQPYDKRATTIQNDGWKIYVKHAEATSFTFGFTPNVDSFNILRVYVVSTRPTSVTLTSPLSDYRHETTVIKGIAIRLPSILKVPEENGIFPLGLTLESNTPVDVYIENGERVTSGGSSVIPTGYLSTEYVLLSWYEKDYTAQLIVIGTVDNTEVNIVFSEGFEKKLKLNRSQMYLHRVKADISGTFITASDSVAVFAGHKCSRVKSQYCDHLYEQIPPIRDLQKEFIVSYPYPRYDYVLRIMAVYDNTEINMSDGSWQLIHRLEMAQFQFKGLPIAVTASKPIMMAVYSLGGFRGEGNRSLFDGSMLIVPGVAQFRSAYNIFVPDDVRQCMLMVIFPSYQTSITRIRLNHEKLVADEITTVTVTGRGQYTILYKQLSKGTSVVYTTDGTPFGAYLSLNRMESQSWFSLSYKHV